MTELCMIVAATKEGVIGVDNTLPWHIPEDLAYFKSMTLGFPVIMGRKTFESIGRPLPGRANYVLTRDTTPIPGVTLIHEPRLPDELIGRRTFIIGGCAVYKAFEEQIDSIFLTEIDLAVSGDAFLPFQISKPIWQINSAEYLKTKSGVVICFQNWSRVSKDE